MSGDPVVPKPHNRHGWLPAAIPAVARRFQIDDPSLAAAVAVSGADLVDASADVEIVASPGTIRAAAPCVLVHADSSRENVGPMPLRAARRLAGFARARSAAGRAARILSRRGYQTVFVITWDRPKQPFLRVPGFADGAPRVRGIAERLPQRSLAAGYRSQPTSTVLDTAVAAAETETKGALRRRAPLLSSSGVLLLVSDVAVLRVAVGPATRLIATQSAAVEALRATRPGSAVSERVPKKLARGASGIGEWSLETRVRGCSVAAPAGDRFFADCLDFLVALHAAGDRDARTQSPTADAEVIAEACRADEAEGLRSLARLVEEELADVPRGFGHGDFACENVLVEAGRLGGVIDWTKGGPGRLPLVDLFHLRLNTEGARTRRHLGETFLDYLLPSVWMGADELVRAYCRRVGLDVDGRRLEALAVAYWLDFVGTELTLYADRAERPIWIDRNVHLVVRSLLDGALHFLPTRTIDGSLPVARGA